MNIYRNIERRSQIEKVMLLFSLIIVLLVACSSDPVEFTVDTAPKYKEDTAYPFTIQVMKDGEPVAGMDVIAILEMEKMDHGKLEASFNDHLDGTYISEVTLPMPGEWIATIKGELDGKTYENTIHIDVTED